MSNIVLNHPVAGLVSIQIDVLEPLNIRPVISKEVKLTAAQWEQRLFVKLLNATVEALDAPQEL